MARNRGVYRNLKKSNKSRVEISDFDFESEFDSKVRRKDGLRPPSLKTKLYSLAINFLLSHPTSKQSYGAQNRRRFLKCKIAVTHVM